MSAAVLAPPAAAPDPRGPSAPVPAPPSRLLMTRAEFEAADEPGTRVEWLGASGETRGGEPLGVVWPVHGFDPDGCFAMATPRHGRIVSNLMFWFGPRVDPDEWFVGTQDVEVGLPTGRSRFPDLVMFREPGRYAPGATGEDRILLSPKVAFEVRGRSTARVDEEDKPADYLSVGTLTDYLLIDQDRPHVVHRRRAGGAEPARWEVTTHDDPAAALTLTEPALTLPLGDLYARVFPAA